MWINGYVAKWSPYPSVEEWWVGWVEDNITACRTLDWRRCHEEDIAALIILVVVEPLNVIVVKNLKWESSWASVLPVPDTCGAFAVLTNLTCAHGCHYL